MKSVKIFQSLSLVALISLGISTYAMAPVVKADNDDKITICHGAGRAGTTHFETLTISRNAVYQDQGNGGHFYENGTPKAGHEQDYVGGCRSAEASPSTNPSASPSVTPSVNPSATPTGSNSNNNSNSGSSNSGSSSNSNTSSQGAVLGAYAETGVVEDVIMNALGTLGGLMTTVGSVFYGKKKNSATR
jgi:hypothetical protein